MDYGRIGTRRQPVSAVDFVRDYSGQLAPYAYEVSRLPENMRPHCTGCGQAVHLYDIKNLKAGITRPVGRKTLANPGFHHYGPSECPYSYSDDPRFADFVSNNEFDVQDVEYNKLALNDPKTRRGREMAMSAFMYPYAGSPIVSAQDNAMIQKLEDKFILPMRGIGSASWLSIFMVALLLPDRERTFKSGKTAILGFRPSWETQKILMTDSQGQKFEKSYPRQITLGYITKRKSKFRKRTKVFDWFGEPQIYDVSRDSALTLWQKGKNNLEKHRVREEKKSVLSNLDRTRPVQVLLPPEMQVKPEQNNMTDKGNRATGTGIIQDSLFENLPAFSPQEAARPIKKSIGAHQATPPRQEGFI